MRGPSGAGRACDNLSLIGLHPTKPQTAPGAAGLAQLEADGAIRRPTAEEVKEFLAGASRQYRSKLSPDFLLYGKFDYVITREVTLPQGLLTSEPKFLVLAGVPAPRGEFRFGGQQ